MFVFVLHYLIQSFIHIATESVYGEVLDKMIAAPSSPAHNKLPANFYVIQQTRNVQERQFVFSVEISKTGT